MAHLDLATVSGLVAAARYADLERGLERAPLEELAGFWSALRPIEKLVVFKLLDAARALEFYDKVPFKEKYFLLCGFSLASIAPILEALSEGDRRLFVQLPREFYDRMFRRLVSERVELTVPVRPN